MGTTKYKVLVDFPGSIWKAGTIIEVPNLGGIIELVEVNNNIGEDDVRSFPEIYQEIIHLSQG